MQLGMIGLGRMGAGLVRRLQNDGHECVVYDVNAAAVTELESTGSTGAGSLAEFASKLTKPRAAWVMVPAAFTGDTVMQLAEQFEEGDIIIDGGNSYYRDDIARAAQAQGAGHPLRRRRHERRRLRARAGLLPDDRRRGGGRAAPRLGVRHDRARRRVRAADSRPRPDHRARPSTATCTAGPTAPATS